MAEYYIKTSPSSESEGPYPVEVLKEFVLSKKINSSTLHFFDDTTGWQPIGANPALCEQLFEDGKKKLVLKHREDTLEDTKAPEVVVKDVLKSSVKKGPLDKIARKRQWEDRVAAFSMPLLSLLNLVMGALLLWTNYHKAIDGWATQGIGTFVYAPGFLLGAVVFILGVFLFLTVAAVYPAVRYTAFALLSYFGIMAWGSLYEGNFEGCFLLFAGIGFGLGVYIATLTLNFAIFSLSIIMAVLGLYAYGYSLFLL